MNNKNEPNVILPFPHASARLTDPGLWERIEGWHATLAADRTLVARVRAALLADEREASEAILEYLRFAYLAWTCPDGATPSKAVDEAWHAHLLFTRSYASFCQATRGEHLHHEPGDGEGDDARFRVAYQATLDRYAREFGDPPSRWWPRGALPPSPPPLVRDAYLAAQVGLLGTAGAVALGVSAGALPALMVGFATVVGVAMAARERPRRVDAAGPDKSGPGGGSSCDGGGATLATAGAIGGDCGDGGACGDGGSSCGSSCGGGGCGGG